MKILIVNTYDIRGGAARACYRLHRALLNAGIDSQMLVQYKESDDDTVIIANSTVAIGKMMGIIRYALDIFPTKLYKNRTSTLFSSSWLPSKNIINKINQINPDLVHLHWICNGMIKIEDLASINFPMVWSLHDMWAFTGGCHYDELEGNYRRGCGNCQVLGSKKETDLSRRLYLKKKKVYQNLDITIVTPSRWLTNAAKESPLLNRFDCRVIPNGLDLKTYYPREKKKARDKFMLPQNKKLIFFGAMGIADKRKGYIELMKALEILNQENKINFELVIFGGGVQSRPSYIHGFKTHYLGVIKDENLLATAYSACDLKVIPSIQEAFGLTASEALACGVPVVAFGTTGLIDIVDHQKNGYLAKTYDPNDLAEGIKWVLLHEATPVVSFDIGSNDDMIVHKEKGYLAKPFGEEDLKNGIDWTLNTPNYKELRQNARNKVVKEFDSVIVAKKYIDLYHKVIKNNHKGALKN